MIYSENDLYKAFTLFQQGFDFYDVTNYFKKNNVSIYDKQKIELIIDAVLLHYQITEKELTGKSRQRHYVNARGAYYYLCRNLTKNSLKFIGKRVNRDHATVLNGYKLVVDLLEFNIDNIKEDIEQVTSIFNEYVEAKTKENNKLIQKLCNVKI
jgi:chromosomal replication initiation ATPase DnaA